MPLAGFELTIPASERSPTDALDRATTGTGIKYHLIGGIKDDKMDRTQGSTNTERQFALVIRFTTTALNIFESSVWIFFSYCPSGACNFELASRFFPGGVHNAWS
jgi:hypothetical protein